MLGKPSPQFDLRPMRAVFDECLVTQHAAEEVVMALRQVLLDPGYASRDIYIAVNVLDIYSKGVFGVRRAVLPAVLFGGPQATMLGTSW